LKHSFIDKYSNISSPVHRIDPAVKFLLALICILAMASEPRGKLFPFYLYGGIIFLIVVLSRVPIAFIFKRLAFIFPFLFVAAAFFPLSAMISGQNIEWSLNDFHVRTGLSILLKANFSVLLLLLLVSTERFHQLLGGLRRLKMPVIVCTISAMMYRYIFIFADESMKTSLARQSRTPGRLRKSKLKVLGNQMAMVFLRSWDRSKIIYSSMLSRGFHGEYYSTDESKPRTSDIIIFCIFGLLFFSIRLMNEIGQLLNINNL
jgi:cobalt/nickel transport system permease protein